MKVIIIFFSTLKLSKEFWCAGIKFVSANLSLGKTSSDATMYLLSALLFPEYFAKDYYANL